MLTKVDLLLTAELRLMSHPLLCIVHAVLKTLKSHYSEDNKFCCYGIFIARFWHVHRYRTIIFVCEVGLFQVMF